MKKIPWERNCPLSFQKKNNPLQSHSCGTTKTPIFFTVSGDGPISLFPLQASIPFACAPDHFFSLTAAVVPKKVVQKSLNVPYTDF